jgi:hypothetical protein
VIEIPQSYYSARVTLGFGSVACGVGGIELYDVSKLDDAQRGYSYDSDGRSLVGSGPGDWLSEWIVIGHETACGDPIFFSTNPPHPVFSAMHGAGTWSPRTVAPSLERFWTCLEIFKGFAVGRSNPVELQANLPGDEEIRAYLMQLLRLCDGDLAAVEFWGIQAEIGMEDEQRQERFERFLETGEWD